MAAMTYESIVAAVRKKLSKADVSSIPGTLAFQVDVEGKAEGIFYIEIKDGQLHVEPYDYHDRNARLIIHGTNLMQLVNGKLDPVLALTVVRTSAAPVFVLSRGGAFFVSFCGGRRCGWFFVSVILVKIPYLFFFFHKRSWKRPANIV